MSRRGILLSLTIAVAILIASDRLIQRMARNSIPRRTIQTIVSAPETIDVLGVGNSLIECGIDTVSVEQTFRKAGRRCVAVNAGLPSSGMIEQLVMARVAFRHHAVRALILGFVDQMMALDVVSKNSDLIGNRSMLYYQEPQLTLQYARFDPLDRVSFQMFRTSALLRERTSIWANVERLRRVMGSLGMPPEETNRFGRLADLALLEARDPQSFQAACQTVIQSGEFLSAPIAALLQQAREHGVKVFVVEMPVSSSHRERFYSLPVWEKFRAGTQAAVESAGATYLDASAWMPDGPLLLDHVHLSRPGGTEFSRRLATIVLQSGN
jgi:ribosomal protein S14